MKKNREELHRTFAGVLYEADFSTDRPSPWNLNRISQSLYYAARAVSYTHLDVYKRQIVI